jgi:hypothetical protein
VRDSWQNPETSGKPPGTVVKNPRK